MDKVYLEYLALLDGVSGALEQLTELSQQKIMAVRTDDLMELERVLKQEQAISMNLRGLEQKRGRQLEELGLSQVPLSGLAAAYPKHLQMQAKQSADRLHAQYELYHGVAEVARSTLECNIHEIEKIIASMGGGSMGGPGYQMADVEPPKNMKTNFWA